MESAFFPENPGVGEAISGRFVEKNAVADGEPAR